MNALIKRALLGVLGLAVTIVWWSVRPNDSKHTSADRIPGSVWGGGGGMVTVEVETSCPAYLSVSFEDRGEDVANHRLLETHEEIPAGTRSWNIDVPPRVGGFVELGARDPQAGARLSWRLMVDGRVVDEQEDTLEQPLEKGYAFFLQTAFDDYGSAQVASEW